MRPFRHRVSFLLFFTCIRLKNFVVVPNCLLDFLKYTYFIAYWFLVRHTLLGLSLLALRRWWWGEHWDLRGAAPCSEACEGEAVDDSKHTASGDEDPHSVAPGALLRRSLRCPWSSALLQALDLEKDPLLPSPRLAKRYRSTSSVSFLPLPDWAIHLGETRR